MRAYKMISLLCKLTGDKMDDDICRCSGKDCPKKDTCMRVDFPEEGIYPYLSKPPYDKRKDECRFYLGKDKDFVMRRNSS